MQKKRGLINCIFIYLICFIPQCIIALSQFPILVGDDLGVLSVPAYLAGRDWTDIWREVSFYGGGYHILMTPFFLFTSNPIIIYRGVICTYVFFQALIGVIAYHIARKYYQTDALYAGITGVICSYFTYAKSTYVSNEIILLFGLWVIILIFFKLLEYDEKPRRKRIFTICLSVWSCYLLTVHLRSTAIIIAIMVVVLFYFFFKKKYLVSPIIYFISTFIGYFIAQNFNTLIQKKIWIADASAELHNSNVFSGIENIIHLFDIRYWHAWAAIFFGQLSTASVMSLGILCPIFILSIYIILKNFRFRKKVQYMEEKYDFVIFSFLTISILITLGGQSITWLENAYNSIQLGAYNTVDDPNTNLARVFTYLRYFSFYTNPLLFMGLIHFRKEFSYIRKILNGGFLLWGILQLFWINYVYPYICNINSVANVYIPFSFSKYGVGAAGDKVYLPAVILCSLALCGTVFVFRRRKYSYGLLIICVGVIFQYLYYGIVHENDWWNRGNATYEALRQYIDELPFDTVYVPYDAMAYEMQFLFNNIRVKKELPDDDVENAVVLSNLYPIDGENYWHSLTENGYISVKLDDNEVIFVKGNKYISWFQRIGVE